MTKNVLFSIAIALLVGGGIGYLVGASKDHELQSDTPIPSTQTMSGTHTAPLENMIADLKGKSGEALDSAFLDGMIAHHQAAVEMANILLEKTKRPELKQMANDIISAQTKEIETMQGWLKEWFGR